MKLAPEIHRAPAWCARSSERDERLKLVNMKRQLRSPPPPRSPVNFFHFPDMIRHQERQSERSSPSWCKLVSSIQLSQLIECQHQISLSEIGRSIPPLGRPGSSSIDGPILCVNPILMRSLPESLRRKPRCPMDGVVHGVDRISQVIGLAATPFQLHLADSVDERLVKTLDSSKAAMSVWGGPDQVHPMLVAPVAHLS